MLDKNQFNQISLEESIKRIDSLLQSNPPKDEEKLGFSLGLRLALEMALEIKNQIPLGQKSGLIISEWVKLYGETMAQNSVEVAREFLTKPDKMREGLEKRLFPN